MLSSAQLQSERQQHTNQPCSTSQHTHHNAPVQRQPAAAMSYSYGPTVVYPSFNMGETFVGGAGYDAAKENSGYAAGFRTANKVCFVSSDAGQHARQQRLHAVVLDDQLICFSICPAGGVRGVPGEQLCAQHGDAAGELTTIE